MNLSVSKGDVGFELEELETAAALVLKEREGGDGVNVLTDKMGQMGVGSSRTVLDSDDDSDEEDEEDSEEDSETSDEGESEEELGQKPGDKHPESETDHRNNGVS